MIIWTDATSYEQQTRKFQLFQCEILTGSIWFLKSYVKRRRKTGKFEIRRRVVLVNQALVKP